MRRFLVVTVALSFVLSASAFSQMAGMSDMKKKQPAKAEKMEMKKGEVCDFERCMTDEMCAKDGCVDRANMVCRFDKCTDMKKFVFARKPVLGFNSVWGLFTSEQHMMMMPKMKEAAMGAKTTHHIACYIVNQTQGSIVLDATVVATLFDSKGVRVGRSDKPLEQMSGHYGADFKLGKGNYRLDATVRLNGKEEKISLPFKVS